MPKAKLFHNPKAGEKDHSEEKLIALIESEGFTCNYVSVKEDGWQNIEPETDILVIAGGDGTVRKVTRALLNKNLPCPYMVGLLPMGTANNIAKTLGIDGPLEDIVRAWHNQKLKQLDFVLVKGLPESSFFIEGFGYGIFPRLMLDMTRIDKKKLDTPEKEIRKALEMLREIVTNYEAKVCEIEVDNERYTHNCLLVEVMNIQSVGPNLLLAPDADPGDGLLQVVVVTEGQRRQYADYLTHILNGVECPLFPYKKYTGKDIKLDWNGTDMHADDELIQVKERQKISLDIQPSALKLLIPDVNIKKDEKINC